MIKKKIVLAVVLLAAGLASAHAQDAAQAADERK
jgi:opacity protein-like surface antigen